MPSCSHQRFERVYYSHERAITSTTKRQLITLKITFAFSHAKCCPSLLWKAEIISHRLFFLITTTTTLYSYREQCGYLSNSSGCLFSFCRRRNVLMMQAHLVRGLYQAFSEYEKKGQRRLFSRKKWRHTQQNVRTRLFWYAWEDSNCLLLQQCAKNTADIIYENVWS